MSAIKLSEKAIEQCQNFYREDPSLGKKKLRLYLEGKGCDGFYYGVSFDEPTSSDHRFPQNLGIEILVDPDTLQFVDGSEIDWIDDERGRGFLVENPNHRKFRGKFFKRKSFLEKSGIN